MLKPRVRAARSDNVIENFIDAIAVFNLQKSGPEPRIFCASFHILQVRVNTCGQIALVDGVVSKSNCVISRITFAGNFVAAAHINHLNQLDQLRRINCAYMQNTRLIARIMPILISAIL
jgi:hypothetical protein